jgi:hypothetical protein
VAAEASISSETSAIWNVSNVIQDIEDILSGKFEIDLELDSIQERFGRRADVNATVLPIYRHRLR